MPGMPRFTRRRWVAEAVGSDMADFTEYQPSYRGAEQRLAIFDDGTLFVCQLPTDSAKKVATTLEGRKWKSKQYARGAVSVIIHQEIP